MQGTDLYVIYELCFFLFMMACILCFSWIRYEKWYVCASVCMCRYLCGVQMYMYGVSGVCMRDVFMQVCICVFIYICTGLSKALDDWCQAKGGLEESVAFSWQFLRVDLRKEGVKPWPNTVCMYVCICDSLSFICMCMYVFCVHVCMCVCTFVCCDICMYMCMYYIYEYAFNLVLNCHNFFVQFHFRHGLKAHRSCAFVNCVHV